MAKLLALLICFLFLAAVVSAEIAPSGVVDDEGADDHKGSNDGKGNLKPSQCAGECDRRCSRTHHRKPCIFFCNKCCAKCLCVPPGYYGNKETCPCYNNWKNKRGGPKCP
ncbi:hypothetical protein EJB05_29792 [Eragrostis curvula]|uniref:Uncharacterized protein n=1 Tax=Eragrostis curvula TaxID=38414 RepID=A0A5J9UVQ0_9POAL|nr:hypothetical protein EJB05_29792 [Eragrostis curvula]